MLRIHSTFLEKLFLAPSFQEDDSDVGTMYLKLKNRMFPGEEDYVAFLQAQSSEDQFSRAENIVHRLCYESNFPPTYYSIKDLISIEEDQARKYSGFDGYVPRDHFIHIVNLYLLGLYVFFYDSAFRNQILCENRFQRDDICFMQHRLDAYKDFVSEWKYFCLYHDVGYTQEFFGNELRVKNVKKEVNRLNQDSNDYKNSFGKNQLLFQSAFFGTLEIMSRVFVWEAVKRLSKQCCDGNSKLFKFFRKERISSNENEEISFEEDCATYLKNKYKLEKVYSNQCLKSLLPIIGDANIVVVGIGRDSGEVSFVSLVTSKKEKTRKLFFLSSLSNDSEIRKYKKYPNLLLFDDFVSDNYEIVYLYDSLGSAKYYTQSVYNSSYVSDAYNYLIDNGFDDQFYGITNTEQFMDFYYKTYLFSYSVMRKYPAMFSASTGSVKVDERLKNDKIDPFSGPDKSRITRLVSNEIKTVLAKDYSDQLKTTCIQIITEKCEPKIDKVEYKNLDSTIDLYVSQYSKALSEIQTDEIKKSLIGHKTFKSVNAKLEHLSAFLTLFTSDYVALKYVLSSANKDNMHEIYYYNYEKRAPVFNNAIFDKYMPSSIGRLTCSTSDFMSLYIDNLTKNNIDKNISTYRSKHDHGFESAKYAISVFTLLQNSIKQRKASDVKQKCMIDTLFSISVTGDNDNGIKHYVDNYEHVFRNVVYAITIHNVFPATFVEEKNRKMITTIEETPFAYFALMCDSLQNWNRPQGISHSYVDLHPYSYASENYDIIIKKNKIYIYECGDSKQQEKIKKDLEGMKHLKNIKSFIEVGYTE